MTSSPQSTPHDDALRQYLDLCDEHRATIDAHAAALLNARRAEAREALSHAKAEGPDNTAHPGISVREMLAPDYGVNISRLAFNSEPATTFRCGVPNISTLLAIVDGDTFRPTSSLLRNLPDGVTVCSLNDIATSRPDLAARYLNSLAPLTDTSTALNTLLLQDGVFIHIDRSVKTDKPIQIINIFSALQPMMATRRIVVALEDGAAASVVVCDHSARPDVGYLSNQVVELHLGRNAELGYYEMEESSPLTRRLNHVYARQEEGSRLTVNSSTLTCGTSLSRIEVHTAGDNTDTNLGGLAIASGKQRIANITDLHHSHLHGTSRQMYKYVASDQAVASFFGIINVDERARFTNASQTNRNILSSPEAKIYTRPQLEIYCDDVKCNHGASVGTLDAAALFYMRSRGIPQAQARLMLMQAFMADVIDSISLPALSQRLHHLVERRLSGDDMLCADCRAADLP